MIIHVKQFQLNHDDVSLLEPFPYHVDPFSTPPINLKKESLQVIFHCHDVLLLIAIIPQALAIHQSFVVLHALILPQVLVLLQALFLPLVLALPHV